MKSNEKGSLALEQVLFIGAIVTMSVGLFIFYGHISEYFQNFSVSNVPSTVTVPTTGAGAGSGSGS